MSTKSIVVLLAFIIQVSAWTQWEIKWQQAISENTVWDLDLAGRILIAERQTLKLRDTTGTVLQQQSSKSIGEITGISANNRMKMAVFSVDQQQICFFDNALAQNGNCIDLAELDMTQAQNMCLSQQTDRIWVYDQFNSQLRLIAIAQQLNQKTTNINGILGLGEVKKMVEQNQLLVVFGTNGKLAYFDKYGNLVEVKDIPQNWVDVQDVIVSKSDGQMVTLGLSANGIERLKGNELVRVVSLPKMEDGELVKSFKINGKYLFLSTNKMLYCAAWRGSVLVE